MSRRPFLLVTGLSGAGRASILNVLEDLGFETVDNPPLNILEGLVEEGGGPLAAGIDSRTRGFEPQLLLEIVGRLRAEPGLAATLIFATADEGVLLRRYTETRRRHPMAPGGPFGSRVQDGIARETVMMAPLRDAADLVLDTSELPLPRMRQIIEARFRPDTAPGLAILVQSFGFPRGLPREADLVFDLRFLANPHYDPALRPLTGLDPRIGAFVAADPGFDGFWSRLVGFLEPLLPRYVAEGKKYLTVAIGCTGGRHRSVFAAEKLADHLRRQGWRADSAHRELGPALHIPAPAGAGDTPVPTPAGDLPAPALSGGASPSVPVGQEAPISEIMTTDCKIPT